MSDSQLSSPTVESDRPSFQEALARDEGVTSQDPDTDLRRELLQALTERAVLRMDELLKCLGYDAPPEDWKAGLWRLHNEGLVKVRWVGLADPDPVEVRITQRGRERLRSTLAGRVSERRA